MAGEAIHSPSGALVSGRITPAVFPFYTTGEDNLRVVSFNAAGGVKVSIVARLLGRDGRPTPSSWPHTPNTDRSVASNDFPLSGQTLLNVHVIATAGAPLIGQCFVIVQLIRGLGAAAIVVGTILAGPVTATQGLGFPGSPIQSANEGAGYLRLVAGTQPAAGSDISETVPTGARWQLLTLRATLTTSAVAANRYPMFRILVNGSVVYQTPNSNATTAGLIALFSVAPNVGYGVDAIHSVNTLPSPQDTTLLAGAQFSIIAPGLLGGDQWSAPIFLVREWLDV